MLVMLSTCVVEVMKIGHVFAIQVKRDNWIVHIVRLVSPTKATLVSKVFIDTLFLWNFLMASIVATGDGALHCARHMR